MTPFYHTRERQSRFLAECHSWLRTPFSPNCKVKGLSGGVDCVRFAAAVHVATGALARIEIPVLPVEWIRSWHEHHAESRLIEFFRQPAIAARLQRIEDEPMIGDVAVLRHGLSEHHVALWAGPMAYHVSIRAGVLAVSTAKPDFLRLIRGFYRIHELPRTEG